MATLAELIARCRVKADMPVGSEFVTDSAFTTWINESLYELYDLLIQKYGNGYFVESYTFVTDGTLDAYPLPTGFYKLLGVDLMIANTSNGWRTVKPFNFADRNNYVFPNVQIAYGVMSNLRYRIVGDNLTFTPRPASGQTLRLWYVPKLTSMISTTPSAISPTTTGLTATITGTPTATSIPHDVLMALIYHSSSASPYLAIFVDGAYGGEVSYSVATKSLNAITGLEGLSLVISADTVSAPTYGLTWTWNTGDPSSYSPVAFDQWLEYVVVDVAIKALTKEESDTKDLVHAKKELKKRIEEAAEHRDAGNPATVSDSNKYSGGDSDGTGYGGPY